MGIVATHYVYRTWCTFKLKFYDRLAIWLLTTCSSSEIYSQTVLNFDNSWNFISLKISCLMVPFSEQKLKNK